MESGYCHLPFLTPVSSGMPTLAFGLMDCQNETLSASCNAFRWSKLTKLRNLWKNHAIGLMVILIALHASFYFAEADTREYIGVTIVGGIYIIYYFIRQR
ncbi:hypothetical protein NYA22BAC_00962 [Parasphingorhabdus sp. NYA22]